METLSLSIVDRIRLMEKSLKTKEELLNYKDERLKDQEDRIQKAAAETEEKLREKTVEMITRENMLLECIIWLRTMHARPLVEYGAHTFSPQGQVYC